MIHRELWVQLRALDPADVGRRSGAARSGSRYLLPVLNLRFEVDPQAEKVSPAAGEPPRKPDFWLALSCVQYLIHAQAIPLAGDLVKADHFDSGGLFFRGLHEMPTATLASRFGSGLADFAARAAALGAPRIPYGDEARTFQLFPHLPITVVLWVEDEEFPARASILFDSTASEQIPLDALWAATRFLASELTRGS